MRITFHSDTKQRKLLFTGLSFAHPAKMVAPLLLWIVDRYTKEGDVLLDPMGGCGTSMLACRLGRNVILNELEPKFVKMCEDNWAKVQTFGAEMGHTMGWCKILQGDARQLDSVLVDAIISSPPYSNMGQNQLTDIGQRVKRMREQGITEKDINHTLSCGMKQEYSDDPKNIGNLPYGNLADVIVSSPPYAEAQSGGGILAAGDKPIHGGQMHSYRPENTGESEGQISQLPYGSIDAVITSPPYEGVVSDNKEGPGAGGSEERFGRWRKGTAKKHSYTQHGEPVDCVITSPPYEAAVSSEKSGIDWSKCERDRRTEPAFNNLPAIGGAPFKYGESPSNIGNLKGQTYLSAMLEVYQACYRVLKPQGLMILVTKNFIRNKQIVRLDEDTIKICEQAGFEFQERHYRKLTSQSFWRTIYQQKYPDAPVLDIEDVLVFKKAPEPSLL